MRCAQSLVDAHTPPTSEWPGGGQTGAVAAREFPKVPQRVFFFLGQSSCSILWHPLYKEGPDLSHSPPLQLGRGLSGSGSHAAQLSTLLSQRLLSPWVFHFLLIPLPATSGNWVSHSVAQALLQGRGLLTWLSPRSPAAGPAQAGLGLQPPWSPRLSQGPFCIEAIPLPSVFSVSSILFGLLSS